MGEASIELSVLLNVDLKLSRLKLLKDLWSKDLSFVFLRLGRLDSTFCAMSPKTY